MSLSFGADYSAAYDALYADKDYDAECDLLEELFRRSARTVHTVLDLGCGTGAHAVRLAQRGFDVVGVDLSEGMLTAARQRAQSAAVDDIRFIHGDMRTVRLNETFDAVIGMFAVLGYQVTDDEVGRALATVRTHLRSGGPFIFDVWYGPAVEAIGPSDRSKTVAIDDGQIERRASAVLERDEHLATVAYRLVARRRGMPEEVSEEVHQVRYFFKEELVGFLTDAGLSLQSLTPFPDTAAPLSSAEWNVIGTAV